MQNSPSGSKPAAAVTVVNSPPWNRSPTPTTLKRLRRRSWWWRSPCRAENRPRLRRRRLPTPHGMWAATMTQTAPCRPSLRPAAAPAVDDEFEPKLDAHADQRGGRDAHWAPSADSDADGLRVDTAADGDVIDLLRRSPPRPTSLKRLRRRSWWWRSPCRSENRPGRRRRLPGPHGMWAATMTSASTNLCASASVAKRTPHDDCAPTSICEAAAGPHPLVDAARVGAEGRGELPSRVVAAAAASASTRSPHV